MLEQKQKNYSNKRPFGEDSRGMEVNFSPSLLFSLSEPWLFCYRKLTFDFLVTPANQVCHRFSRQVQFAGASSLVTFCLTLARDFM